VIGMIGMIAVPQDPDHKTAHKQSRAVKQSDSSHKAGLLAQLTFFLCPLRDGLPAAQEAWQSINSRLPRMDLTCRS